MSKSLLVCAGIFITLCVSASASSWYDYYPPPSSSDEYDYYGPSPSSSDEYDYYGPSPSSPDDYDYYGPSPSYSDDYNYYGTPSSYSDEYDYYGPPPPPTTTRPPPTTTHPPPTTTRPPPTTTPDPCKCSQQQIDKLYAERQFEYVATVQHGDDFIPVNPPAGYKFAVIKVVGVCKGETPFQYLARLNTMDPKSGGYPISMCPNAFAHLQVGKKYIFFGKLLMIEGRRTFVVDRCTPPADGDYRTCPNPYNG